ncbi:MAG: hypothetical protein IV105_21055 [Rhizobacter sp.]|nr:hypothetical protein [Rhizobacter sp.]
MIQNLLVALIVLACAVYAVWALLPMAWRRALAKRLVAAPSPPPIKRWLQQAAQAGNACGCDGCDRAAPKAKPEAQQIRFHPRRH